MFRWEGSHLSHSSLSHTAGFLGFGDAPISGLPSRSTVVNASTVFQHGSIQFSVLDKSMKVFVTGEPGYGNAILRQLKTAGHESVALVRSAYEPIVFEGIEMNLLQVTCLTVK